MPLSPLEMMQMKVGDHDGFEKKDDSFSHERWECYLTDIGISKPKEKMDTASYMIHEKPRCFL